MTLSLEQSQKITDLRQKMLRNVREGKPSHEGITEEELAEGLSFLRQNRILPAKAAAKKKAASKAPVKFDASNPKFAAFANLFKTEE